MTPSSMVCAQTGAVNATAKPAAQASLAARVTARALSMVAATVPSNP
jgi:hypothetical protein